MIKSLLGVARFIHNIPNHNGRYDIKNQYVERSDSIKKTLRIYSFLMIQNESQSLSHWVLDYPELTYKQLIAIFI
jgi:hypothetical protein